MTDLGGAHVQRHQRVDAQAAASRWVTRTIVLLGLGELVTLLGLG
ncbi:MAG: hypothetical protein QM736_10710 [Vicinamibacterales bacterium]